MSKIEIPNFQNKQETFKWLADNHDKIIAQKKAITKEADEVSSNSLIIEKGDAQKANTNNVNESELAYIERKCVINSTNYLDSHDDVHIPGLWKKSLKETKTFYLVKEHKFDFDNVITKEVNAFTEMINWRDLGLKIDGQSECLIFLSNIPKSDKTGMYDWYFKNQVKNHSVGMRYVKILFCMNSEDEEYYQYKVNYDKYITEIVNRDEAEQKGYFWAVLEAKIIEGSAVLRGSNPITPTLNNKIEPLTDTQEEPPTGTQEKAFDLMKAIQETKFIKI